MLGYIYAIVESSTLLVLGRGACEGFYTENGQWFWLHVFYV